MLVYISYIYNQHQLAKYYLPLCCLLPCSAQPQVIVPSTTCSTSRSANRHFPDNASTVDKVVTPISTSNPPITVLLPKDKVTADATCNLLLSPILFLSNDISKTGLTFGSNALQNVTLSKQGTLDISAHREEVSTLVKKGVDPLGNGTSVTIGGKKQNATQQGGSTVNVVGLDGEDCSVTHVGQTNCDEDLRNGRSSSVEAEDSLGDLLSKHFDPDSTDNSLSGLATSPSSEIAKQRSLLGRTKIRHVCDICNRECPSKHKLRRHLSTHSEERPFACQLCGKTFKWTEYLQKHMRQQHVNGAEGTVQFMRFMVVYIRVMSSMIVCDPWLLYMHACHTSYMHVIHLHACDS